MSLHAKRMKLQLRDALLLFAQQLSTGLDGLVTCHSPPLLKPRTSSHASQNLPFLQGCTINLCNLQEDFECDYGFQRVGNSSCLPMLGISPNDCEQVANGNWYQSESHLRLIHNDTCSHVERVVRDSDGHGTCVGPNCPNGSQHKGRGALAKFFIFLVVCSRLTGPHWSQSKSQCKLQLCL